MEASRFFIIFDHAAYEATRLSLDASRQMPQGETTYEPLATAPKASGGVLLAIRSLHCEMPDIAAAVGHFLSNGQAQEISQQEYFAAVAS